MNNFEYSNQLDALISQFYFRMKLYMFQTVPLSIIRSISLYTQQCVYSEILLMMIEELSEPCRVSFQNKIEKLVHLYGFIIRNLSQCTVT